MAWKSMEEHFLKRNLLSIVVAILFLCSFAGYTWAEYGYFSDQAISHHEKPPSFWSEEHMHDYIYNLASNWQSELIFGVLLVTILLRAEGNEGKDKA